MVPVATSFIFAATETIAAMIGKMIKNLEAMLHVAVD